MRPDIRMSFRVLLVDDVSIPERLVEYALASIAFVWLQNVEQQPRGPRRRFEVAFRRRLPVPGVGMEAAGQLDADSEPFLFLFGTDTLFGPYEQAKEIWHIPLIVCAAHEAMHAVQVQRGQDPGAAGDELINSGVDAYLNHPFETEADTEAIAVLGGHEGGEGVSEWRMRNKTFSLPAHGPYNDWWDRWAEGERVYAWSASRIHLPQTVVDPR